jgi:hypothetical protein
MLKRLIWESEGQAAAEFGLALLVLLPLVFWTLRFTDLMNERMEVIQAARYVVWERAYGRSESDIQAHAAGFLKEASIFSGGSHVSLQVRVNPPRSTRDDMWSLALPVPEALGLQRNNYYTCSVTMRDQLFNGLNISSTARYGLIADPWHLTDRNRNGSIDNDDLEKAVYGIWGYPVLDKLNGILDVSRKIQDSWIIQLLSHIPGIDFSLDIEPRGYPKLESVPMPSN